MDRVFSFLLWPKREVCGPWKLGRKKRGSITCRTDRASKANKMFIIWLCWLLRARGLYGYLRTWNWPITAREISQPYSKQVYLLLLYYFVLFYNYFQYKFVFLNIKTKGFIWYFKYQWWFFFLFITRLIRAILRNLWRFCYYPVCWLSLFHSSMRTTRRHFWQAHV